MDSYIELHFFERACKEKQTGTGLKTNKSSRALSTYLDMELQVLIHGVDVVEDVLDNPGDDAHTILIMEVPLYRAQTYYQPSVGSLCSRSSVTLVTGRTNHIRSSN